MIKLSKDLKQMLTGLAYQDAGDFLSIREKMKALGNHPVNHGEKPAQPSGFESRPAIKRIAFISNGSGLDNPLDYAIDACDRQDAQIDLLIHGTTDSKNISALENKIKNAGISYRQIQLEANAVDSIIEYIIQHPSLIYLIASSNDDAALNLVEDVLPKRGRRIQVPVVLIEDQGTSRLSSRSAA